MKKAQIKIGGTYRARVSGKITTVRVDAMREHDTQRGFCRSVLQTHYDVTNLATGRNLTFRSAMKFRSEVNPNQFEAEQRKAIGILDAYPPPHNMA